MTKEKRDKPQLLREEIKPQNPIPNLNESEEDDETFCFREEKTFPMDLALTSLNPKTIEPTIKDQVSISAQEVSDELEMEEPHENQLKDQEESSAKFLQSLMFLKSFFIRRLP